MYNIPADPKIDKETLYSKIGQEKIMEHYLGVPVKKGLFTCPSFMRKDSKPTCAFYKTSKDILMFKDFAGISGDAVSIVMEIHQCSYYIALRTIANDFGLIDHPTIPKNTAKIEYSGNVLDETKQAIIQIEVQEFSEKELDWWDNYGVSLDILKFYKVYSAKSVFLNDRYFSSSTKSSPVYGYYGGKNTAKLEMWRLYMPTKVNYRFLSNWTTIMLQGERQLPKEGDHLIITKSLKDVMSLHSVGINAVAPISETVVITENKNKRFYNRFGRILCLFDNDLPGVKGAQKYKREHDHPCVFIKRKYAKDFSDLYKKLNFHQRLDCAEQLQTIIADNTVTNTKYFYVFNGKGKGKREETKEKISGV